MTAGHAIARADEPAAAGAGLFEPGRNCWRVESASRVALLVDGDAYFKALVAAARNAQRSILIAGWDFHSRTRLLCPAENGGQELLLGEFLNQLARQRRDLQIHILIWDYPMIFGMDREWAPIYGLGWKPHRRVHFRYDNTHPTGGSHHQKIVVIDDSVAFNGGIDLTARRWDTCAHAAHAELRVADGTAYPPFHDMMMAVEGPVAHALGDLFRDRWWLATGETLPQLHSRRTRWRFRARTTGPAASPWPEDLEPELHEVQVAISRTSPSVNGHEGLREIEALYLDMIATARERIYMENQYFTADRIGTALEARLAEPDGPEVIVVLRKLSHGWLEEMTMEALRTRMIARLRAADRYQRLRVVYPFLEGLKDGTCIDVHSKMMIVDDDIVRIGSANAANRSMGLDTECDLTIDARGQVAVQRVIAEFRTGLLAEHLGSTPRQVQQAFERSGSLREVITELRQEQRTLRDLEDAPQDSTLLSVASVADPEKPVEFADLVKILSADDSAQSSSSPRSGPAWGKLMIVVLVLAGLTALWQFTPLSALLDGRRITAWAREFGNNWWAPWLAVLAYTPAVLVMFPRSPITLFAVIAFGPWQGFVYAMAGMELAAWASYVAGQQFERDTVRRMAGRRLNDVINVLRRRGLIAITALRLVPLAPFSIEGVIAGAVGIRLWHFMLGTAIGLLPGTLVATVFGQQIEAALDGRADFNYWLLGVAVLILVVATWRIRRWLLTSVDEMRSTSGTAAAQLRRRVDGTGVAS